MTLRFEFSIKFKFSIDVTSRCKWKSLKLGGADRDRTGDPLLAKQVLSQLSYSPKRYHVMVGLGRLELPTSPLSGVRSNQTELQAQT